MKLKVAEFFGGIGSPRAGLIKANIDFDVVDYVEIDKYAVKSYNAMYDENYDIQDICEWDKDIEVDLLFHGSPCVSFSIAGKQEGGNEGSETRSSLMWETVRIIENTKPKFVIWENVKNVLSKKHKHNFDLYISKLEELGYNSYWKVLNTKDYGLPQNRERLFCLSIKKKLDIGFEFPEKQELKLRLRDMLEDEVDEKYYLKDKGILYVTNQKRLDKMYTQINGDIALCHTAVGQTNWTGTFVSEHKINQIGMLDIKGNEQVRQVYGSDGISPTLNTMQGGNRQPKVLEKSRIRKLTPKECWRLQGFSDEQFEKAEKVCSNSQLYKQAGNSISVTVLEAIYEQMVKFGYIEKLKEANLESFALKI